MSFKEVITLLDEIQAHRVVMLCHQNSDPDAVCSAYGLQQLLKKVRPKIISEIGTSEGISKLTKNLFDYLPIKVKTQPNVDAAQAIILVDTNTIQQLPSLADKLSKTRAPMIVVDHHAAHPQTAAICKICITNEQASSTCDIVFGFWRERKLRPDADTARALFLGMAFDTRHFALANTATFKAVAELLDTGINPQETLPKLALPMDLSERVARLKACKRAKIIRKGNWVLAFSHVSAFEASAARALSDLGAHMAAVAGKKGDAVEISLRCSREFTQKTGIHLGKDIAKPMGEKLNGMGGGHAMAAGVNGKGEVEEALKLCYGLFKRKLAKFE